MSESVQEDLREFVTELIEHGGGLVDWSAESRRGQAMMGEELAGGPAEGEILNLSMEPDDEGMFVSLASDFLDTAQEWLEVVPRIGDIHLPQAYLKGGDIREAVDRSFTWLNAKVLVAGSEPARIEYHTWWFHVLLASEDRWESRISLTINETTGIEVDFPDPLRLWDLEPGAGESEPSTTHEVASATAWFHLQQLAAGFFARMDTHLERDRKRLSEYYNALRRETEKKRSRARGSIDSDQAAAADRAVSLELERKLAELDERYMIHATLRPLVVIRTEIPVLKVDLVIQRKQAVRKVAVYWNSLTKAFEPIRCTACGRGDFSLAFTNDHVEALCVGCSN